MKSRYIFLLLLTLITLLVLNIGISMILFRNSDGNAKQINDVGRIRGGIQRIVKLQYAGVRSEALVEQMDQRVAQLVQICKEDTEDPARYDKAVRFQDKWTALKALLARYDEAPTANNGTALREASEEIWEIADEAVDASQFIDEKHLSNLKYTMALIVADLLLAIVVVYLIKSYVRNELEFYANHDPLTRLYNRKYFMSFFAHLLRQAARYQQDISVVLIDIDHFKHVNDTYGHSAGDKVLVELANLLTANTRKSDIVSRFGGEEFIVLLPNTDEKSAYAAADKLRCAVETHPFTAAERVTISLGAYTRRENDGEDVMIQKADIALYQAKNTGRNKVVSFLEDGALFSFTAPDV